MTADEGIRKEWKKDRQAGFTLLCETYGRTVYSICYRYTGSREDALDLVQETYICLYSSFDRIRPDLPIRPWLCRISANVCLNFLRDRKNTVPLQEDSMGAGGQEAFRQLDDRILLDRCLGQLPPDMRMALILRHRQDLTCREIAEAMELPEGTVKTLLHRGRKRLREMLMKSGEMGA